MKYDVDSYHDNCFMITGSGVHVALIESMLHTTMHYTWALSPKVWCLSDKWQNHLAHGGLTSYVCNESLVYIAQKIG